MARTKPPQTQGDCLARLQGKVGLAMNEKLRNEQVWLAVGSLMILAVVALAGALFYTRAVMIPFVLAIFVTTAVSPMVDALVVRCRVPGWIAISIALILVLAIVTLLGAAL